MDDYRLRAYRRKCKYDAMEEMQDRNPLALRIGNNIRMLRRENNESMEQLACILSLPKTTISLFEAGLRVPGLEAICKDAKHYDVTVDVLIHASSAELKKIVGYRRNPNPFGRVFKGLTKRQNK